MPGSAWRSSFEAVFRSSGPLLAGLAGFAAAGLAGWLAGVGLAVWADANEAGNTSIEAKAIARTVMRFIVSDSFIGTRAGRVRSARSASALPCSAWSRLARQ